MNFTLSDEVAGGVKAMIKASFTSLIKLTLPVLLSTAPCHKSALKTALSCLCIFNSNPNFNLQHLHLPTTPTPISNLHSTHSLSTQNQSLKMSEQTQPPTTAQQQMAAPPADNAARASSTEQPRPVEQMSTTESVKMRGGGEGEDICCGLCAACACFECLNCCC